MGTKLEYAINLLASSSNRRSLNAHRVDDWDCFQAKELKKNYQRIGVGNFQSSMDRILEKHNMESIKKTMQMHEDIFKHQVQELHRLYSVQKMLTEELKKEIKQNRYWNPMNTASDINQFQFTNRHHSTTQTTYGYNFHIPNLRDDPSARERSGSCSADNTRMTRGFDLERPVAEEDISTSVSAINEDQAGPSSFVPQRSSNKKSTGSDEESEVELTLSIGGCLSKKKPKNHHPHHSNNQELGCLSTKEVRELDSQASFKSDRGEDCSSPNTPMSSSSATFGQDRKQPHWLFQGLSINRT